MKIVIAPDSFKGSLKASEVAEAMARAASRVLPQAELINCPLSDGGEGLVESIVTATQGQIVKAWVTGPLGDKVEAFFGILGDRQTAVIEMAAASGLPLVPPAKRNPLITTTYGTGELIRQALDLGCRKIIIGIGGSATNDGGVGMAQALGAHFYNEQGQELGPGGGQLRRLAAIDLSELDRRLAHTEIQVACDVTNPLLGPQGAAQVYGPQKGATPETIPVLEGGLARLAAVMAEQLQVEVAEKPGSGAAGGLGAGLMGFLDATLMPGIELVMEAVQLNDLLPQANLVLTGEGKIDSQSAYGKVPVGVARQARRWGVPTVVIAGTVDQDTISLFSEGITACFSITNGPMELAQACQRGAELVEFATVQVLRLWSSGCANLSGNGS